MASLHIKFKSWSDPWVEDWSPNYGENLFKGSGSVIRIDVEALLDIHNAISKLILSFNLQTKVINSFGIKVQRSTMRH